jgi:hypothetical protein
MAKKPRRRKKGVPPTMPADQEEKEAANGELREGAHVDKIRGILGRVVTFPIASAALSSSTMPG